MNTQTDDSLKARKDNQQKLHACWQTQEQVFLNLLSKRICQAVEQRTDDIDLNMQERVLDVLETWVPRWTDDKSKAL